MENREKSDEPVIANKELAFQNEEKEKRAAELVIANKELAFQNEEKDKRAAELIIANKELAFQNQEKKKRARELIFSAMAYDKQRKEAEEYKQHLAAIVEFSDDAIISNSLDGTIKSWNKGGEKIFGYSPAEAIGKNILLIIPPDRVDEETNILNKIYNNEIINHFETIRIKKNGERFPVAITVSPLKDASGRITGISKIIRDITWKKNREEEIILANKKLTAKSKEDEKREGDLLTANKDLESFSYSVSHDLRTPLRAINGYAKMLEEDYSTVLDAEGKRFLVEVRSNANKMGVLIDDLLTFSRLGRKGITRSRVDINKLLETVLSEINLGMTHHAQIKFSNLLPSFADYNLLQHVFTNLLSNAIKYSSKKEKPLIEIKSERKNGKLKYSICDNGVGFDMQYAHKLFGVFQRLHSNEEFSGTGVGLAIVQRIIHKHDGKVWAEGKEGQGATFFFSLPDLAEIEQ